MDIRSFFSALLIFACPIAANAFSCEPGPLFELGDQASYRFTESNAAPVDVSLTAVQQTDIELVFAVQEDGVSYQVSYPTSCGFEFLGGPEADLVAPRFSNFYRVTEILAIDPWVFGPGNPAAHINRVSNSCISDEPTAVELCNTRYEPSAENGVIEVQTRFIPDIFDDPLNQLLTKTQRYADGRIDTIERIDRATDENSDNIPGTPQNLQALVYSNTSAELIWQRADASERIVGYEVRRGGELLADLDGTSYFDGNREIGLEYLYSVTAVRDDGRRSAAATIIATAFGGIDPSSVESFFAAALPAVEGLRADVYSQTAAEIFWQQGDIAVPVRYELSRNDRVLGEFEGTSFFDDDLAPGIRYDYAVVAIGPGDIRSTPAFVTFITPGVASAAPGNTGVLFDIDHVVYSNTALELFWPDFDGSASTGFRYDVYQDGELVAVVDGQSYFADGLNPGQSYEFQVFVFDVRNLQVANSRVVQVTTEPRGPSEIIEPVPGESIAGRPFVEGTRISWRGPGWYQVLAQEDFTSLCEGGSFCDVASGRYIVINHTTGERWENILVVDNATQQRDTDGDGIPDFMDVDQTGGIDNNFDGIDDAFQS